jgi:hypothetical protein
MAAVPVAGYQAFWADNRSSLQAEYKTLMGNYPDADTQYRQLFKVLCDIEDVAGYTLAVFRERAEWTAIASAAEENRTNYCKAPSGKTFFSALYGTYTVTLNDLKSILKAQQLCRQNHREGNTGGRLPRASGRAPPKTPRLRKKQCLPP